MKRAIRYLPARTKPEVKAGADFRPPPSASGVGVASALVGVASAGVGVARSAFVLRGSRSGNAIRGARQTANYRTRAPPPARRAGLGAGRPHHQVPVRERAVSRPFGAVDPQPEDVGRPVRRFGDKATPVIADPGDVGGPPVHDE